MNPNFLNKIALNDALERVKQSGKLFEVLFTHGSLSVELYKPDKIDQQTPHSRDEVYIVATGTGKFNLDNAVVHLQSGDFLFVPARTAHHFFDFSDDFSTWVLFYGPENGESPTAL